MNNNLNNVMGGLEGMRLQNSISAVNAARLGTPSPMTELAGLLEGLKINNQKRNTTPIRSILYPKIQKTKKNRYEVRKNIRKTGINLEERRLQRMRLANTLRKKKRASELQKKRFFFTTNQDTSPFNNLAAAPNNVTITEPEIAPIETTAVEPTPLPEITKPKGTKTAMSTIIRQQNLRPTTLKQRLRPRNTSGRVITPASTTSTRTNTRRTPIKTAAIKRVPPQPKPKVVEEKPAVTPARTTIVTRRVPKTPNARFIHKEGAVRSPLTGLVASTARTVEKAKRNLEIQEEKQRQEELARKLYYSQLVMIRDILKDVHYIKRQSDFVLGEIQIDSPKKSAAFKEAQNTITKQIVALQELARQIKWDIKAQKEIKTLQKKAHKLQADIEALRNQLSKYLGGKPLPELVKNTATEFGNMVESLEHLTRDQFEQVSNVHKQCREVLGAPAANQLCWLCGFPLKGLIGMEGIVIKTEMLDKPTCEHVLPIKLAIGLTGLWEDQKEAIGGKGISAKAESDLLHSEQEYAHNYCNQIKNKVFFLSLPYPVANNSSDLKSFCRIIVNENKINELLDNLYTGYLGGKQDSFVERRGARRNEIYKNLVAAQIAVSGSSPGAWKERQRDLIIQKMNRMIRQIQVADDCFGDSSQKGRYYATWRNRTQRGRAIKKINPNVHTTGSPKFMNLPRTSSQMELRGLAAAPSALLPEDEEEAVVMTTSQMTESDRNMNNMNENKNRSGANGSGANGSGIGMNFNL